MRRFRDTVPVLVFALLIAATSVLPALGQDEGRRGDRRPRMDWQNMSQEQQDQMRERFEQRLKEMRKEQSERMREDLQLSEEEYGALQPMIERVQQLARESLVAGRSFFGDRGRGGPGGGPGGGRGFNPFGDEDSMSPQGKLLTEASEALRETLENQDATSDEIKGRLASLRQARVAMQDALREAREELRGYVTPKQEATLVLQGLLD
jgi:Spy/CpxP family protein refolding chaperone